jgi:TolB-like protein/Flp pilus assembly protein TadD
VCYGIIGDHLEFRVDPGEPRRPVRFGLFELHPSAFELRRGSRRIRLERRPMELLILLVERASDLVSREEIVERLWGPDVFVDSDAGVNTAIRKVRRALGESAERPLYIDTVPGKGYRFIAPVVSAATATHLTIAVLPFANLSGDPSLEYLADGLTEETIAALGQVDSDRLTVIGRTSIIRYRNTRKALQEIARELGASYVVESSIRGENAWLRITSRLIRAQDESVLWSAAYDRQSINILRLQRKLCRAIADEIRVRLSPARVARLGRRQTHSSDAYDLYLRGRQAWNQLTPATTQRAIDFYIRATTVDGDYALAWSGLADAYASGPITGDRRPSDVWQRAKDAVQHALRAQPDLAEAQTSSGVLKFWLDWDWPGAEAALRRAIALDGHYAYAFRMLGHVLSQTGRHHAARLALQRARELDPLYAMHHALSAQLTFQARDFDAALEHARQSLAVDPDFWTGYHQLAQVQQQRGEIEAALAAADTASRLSGGNSKAVSLRAYILATTGRDREASSLVTALEETARSRYAPPYAIALGYLGLQRVDAMFEWLERAYDARDVHLVFAPADPKWDPYRGDRRFQDLMSRCGFTQ